MVVSPPPLLADVCVHSCIGSDVNTISPEPNLFIFIWLYKLKLLYDLPHVFLPYSQTTHFIPVGQLCILYTVLHDINYIIIICVLQLVSHKRETYVRQQLDVDLCRKARITPC